MANLGNGDTASILETHDMQPEELNEGEIIKKSEETGYDKRDKDVSEEVKLPLNLTLKDLSEIFQNIESIKGKM